MEEKKSSKLFLAYIGISWVFALILIFADDKSLSSTFISAYSVVLFVVLPALVFQKKIIGYIKETLIDVEKEVRNFRLLAGFHILIPTLALFAGKSFFSVVLFSAIMMLITYSVMYRWSILDYLKNSFSK